MLPGNKIFNLITSSASTLNSFCSISARQIQESHHHHQQQHRHHQQQQIIINIANLPQHKQQTTQQFNDYLFWVGIIWFIFIIQHKLLGAFAGGNPDLARLEEKKLNQNAGKFQSRISNIFTTSSNQSWISKHKTQILQPRNTYFPHKATLKDNMDRMNTNRLLKIQ